MNVERVRAVAGLLAVIRAGRAAVRGIGKKVQWRKEPREMAKRKYAVRYEVEPWGKPVRVPTANVQPGVRVTSDNSGYCDLLFVGSVLLNDAEEIASVLLLSSESDGLSRRLLEAVRDQIDHHLEHHADA